MCSSLCCLSWSKIRNNSNDWADFWSEQVGKQNWPLWDRKAHGRSRLWAVEIRSMILKRLGFRCLIVIQRGWGVDSRYTRLIFRRWSWPADKNLEDISVGTALKIWTWRSRRHDKDTKEPENWVLACHGRVKEIKGAARNGVCERGEPRVCCVLKTLKPKEESISEKRVVQLCQM